MTLSLRRIARCSPALAEKADHDVMEHGKVIGRVYEGWHTPPDLRWFWTITAFHMDPGLQTGECPRLRRQRRNSS